jgi:hypothetical protein
MTGPGVPPPSTIAVTCPRPTPAAFASASAFLRALSTAASSACASSFSRPEDDSIGPETSFAPARVAASITAPARSSSCIVTETEFRAV